MIHPFPWTLPLMMNLKFDDNFYVCMFLFHRFAARFHCLFLYVNVYFSLFVYGRTVFVFVFFLPPYLYVLCDIFLIVTNNMYRKTRNTNSFIYVYIYMYQWGIFFSKNFAKIKNFFFSARKKLK